MGWPTRTDYALELQNPRSCFRDRELRQSRVSRLNAIGLPQPVSGNFACVFELEAPQRRLGVRCLTSEVDHYQQRYAAISDALRGRPDWAIDFQFIETGIAIRGSWYPVLKMEWIEGKTLSEYVEGELGRPDALRSLARSFAAAVEQLRRAGIAHGDLQDGNVLVTQAGAPRFVDYDGMYVPALASLSSPVAGHPNYQHPDRGSEFGPDLDNFSAWIIFLSLYALSVDPSLWHELDAGDQQLLFTISDYSAATEGPAARTLDRRGDQRLKRVADKVRELVRCDRFEVPPLDPRGFLRDETPSRRLPEWVSLESDEGDRSPPRRGMVGTSEGRADDWLGQPGEVRRQVRAAREPGGLSGGAYIAMSLWLLVIAVLVVVVVFKGG